MSISKHSSYHPPPLSVVFPELSPTLPVQVSLLVLGHVSDSGPQSPGTILEIVQPRSHNVKRKGAVGLDVL
ncbi:hypothetical protein QWA68_002408 [Fusarium oxysporum]|nr:hypothetical protein QWA68_002408 [Fusarium oxysporum]